MPSARALLMRPPLASSVTVSPPALRPTHVEVGGSIEQNAAALIEDEGEGVIVARASEQRGRLPCVKAQAGTSVADRYAMPPCQNSHISHIPEKGKVN